MRDQLRDTFDKIDWSRERAPRSGVGSTLKNTARLRNALPRVFETYNVTTFFDAPCGDWFWMREVDLSGIKYIGADIAPSIVEANVSEYGDRSGVSFEVVDITSDPLPKADMMLCRDCLFHLKFWLRWKFFENFAASEIPYLMLTMHHVPENKRLTENGGFRPFNPTKAPFNLPAPLELIPETMDAFPADIETNPELQRKKHRSVAVWSQEQVQEALDNRETQKES